MSNVITYARCPVCDSSDIGEVFVATDHTVSRKKFAIWQCNDCGCRFTQHVPDARDIGPYYQSSDYVSHSDTNKGLVNKLYHLVRHFTVSAKKKLIERQVGKKGALLDVGAGTGAFVSVMKAAGWNVTGLEPDATARENAEKNHGLQLQPLEELFKLTEGQFDVITLWHVLEHVHPLHEYLDTFRRILKNDGLLVIAVPNYTSRDARVYGEYWAAYDVPRHLYHFSPASMDRLLQQHGFRVVTRKPMWFDSFYVSMLSEQYKSGHSHFLKAAWNGLLSNIHATGHVGRCSSVIYLIKKAKAD